jgi:hypothetical protein
VACVRVCVCCCSYKLPYDLNKGSSGNFVYLCYRLGFLDGPEEPVTDIVICADATRTGPGTQPPSPDYKRLETDLNKGAAGHFVYLCYKKGRVDPPISDLYVMGGRNCENLAPPIGFEQIPLDLNIQNWGNWCVLCPYMRQPGWPTHMDGEKLAGQGKG